MGFVEVGNMFLHAKEATQSHKIYECQGSVKLKVLDAHIQTLFVLGLLAHL